MKVYLICKYTDLGNHDSFIVDEVFRDETEAEEQLISLKINTLEECRDMWFIEEHELR